MKREERDHNLGEADGAKANAADEIVENLNPFSSPHYKKGFRHGIEQQSKTRRYDYDSDDNVSSFLDPSLVFAILRPAFVLILIGAIIVGSIALLRYGYEFLSGIHLSPPSNNVAQAKRNSQPSGGTQPKATVSLTKAKQSIPTILKSIYEALNNGDIGATRLLVSSELINSTEKLEAICKPFNYRAHYIEAMVERPDQVFEVRAHVLLRPLDEYAYSLLFRISQDRFYLADVIEPSENWIDPQKKIAEELARKFIYAARAGRQDILKQIVSPAFDTTPFITDPCWKVFFENINQITYPSVSIEADRGRKLKVELFLDACSNAQGTFVVDRIDGEYKIVKADPYGHSICFGLHAEAGNKCSSTFPEIVEDRNLEEYTLRRFGLIN